MSAENSFFHDVWNVARAIPSGRVTSYGAIARCLGSTRSARMVGWAMNASHTSPEPVPAHRVVNRYGRLTGKHHFPGSDLMSQLLQSEGVEVIEDQIVRWSEVFWDPLIELEV